MLGDGGADLAVADVLAFFQLVICSGVLDVNHESDVIFLFNLAIGNGLLQSGLQLGQTAHAFQGAPVAVLGDGADVFGRVARCVVVSIFQVGNGIEGVAAGDTGAQIDAIGVHGLACLVHQQEVLRTGAGQLIKGADDVGSGLAHVGQGSAVGLLQLLDDELAVFVQLGGAVFVAIINDVELADVMSAIVATADIPEGEAFGSAGDGDGAGIGEVTVVSVQPAASSDQRCHCGQTSGRAWDR